MNKARITRINDEIRKEIAGIILSELKDPRVRIVVSVTRVETTGDLKYCKVYISALGDEATAKGAFEAVTSAAGFIRSMLAKRLNLRVTPELTFIRDDSIERGIRLSKLIDEANAPRVSPPTPPL